MERSITEGSLVWIEIAATGEIDELKEFYHGVFPSWEFHVPYPGTSVAGYSVPKGLGGGIVKMPEGCKTQNQPMGCGLTNYYSVANLEEIEKKVLELGGKTCLEKQKQGDEGWFMNFLDPQGNRFGAYQFGQ